MGDRDIDEASPPANPIEFPPPTVHRGRRETVRCYNHETRSYFRAKNVLFRDEDDWSCLQRAYWPVPSKPPIKTIMGHVRICLVLSPHTSELVFQTTKEYVAVKVNYHVRMNKLRDNHAEDPLKEIAALQLIGNEHPNVLGCHDLLDDGNNLNVVMPYCSSGDLFQLLQDSNRFREDDARYWFRQVVTGIQHLHSVGVCHRDLSLENIMVDGSRCAIIDMGMCLGMPYTDPNEPNAVTDVTRGGRRRLVLPQGRFGKLPYMSPEIYRSSESFDGCAIDVWSAGTILFCLLTGCQPYEIPHESDIHFHYTTRHLGVLLQDWGIAISPDCVDLLQKMLQVDPRLRLTVDEVLEHPWFQQPDEIMDDY